MICSKAGGNDGNLEGASGSDSSRGKHLAGVPTGSKKSKSEHPDRQILIVICSKAGGNDGNLGGASGSDSSRG